LQTPWEVKFAHRGLDHSVGLNFGPDNRLYSGGELGQVYVMERDNEKPRELARTGGFVGGLVIDGRNNIYACDSGKKAILRVGQDGKVESYCSEIGPNKIPLILPNYPLFDDAGNLYFSDSGPQGSYGDYWKATGKIIKVNPDRSSGVVLSSLYFPSGLALSGDAKSMFIVQSSAANVLKAEIEQDGSIGTPEIFAQLPDTVPEGIAIDLLGRIYVSCYRPDAIYRVDKNRNIELVIRDDTSEIMNRVTNIAFPPDGSSTIYFANMGGWHIGALNVDVGGMKLRFPNVS
jgi:gluconolactonase